MDFNDVTFDICRKYIRDQRRHLGEENYKLILGWIRSRNHPFLASAVSRCELAYASLHRCKALRQVEAFFKKNAIFSEPTICTQAAQFSFERAEKICRITNRRLEYYYTKRDRLDPDLSFWCSRAEEYISNCLGSYDDFLGQLPKLVRLTSGATSTSSRRNSAPHMKVSLRMNCTKPAVPYLRALAKSFGYRPGRNRVVVSNRVEFVPKSWKTDRTIACEPTGNLPLQLAFDTYCKRRLRRYGIDLSSQLRNQEMSREGSMTGEKYSTLDLSMASDTLALNTVHWLLPKPWVKYLCDVRTPFGRLNGNLLKYAKFSSMGNGATFSLETLVFASACYAVGSKDFSVYGDDIVITREHFSDLLRFLRFLGFQANVDKSFSQGPFRESCGLDSYDGVDITPFYLRNWNGLKALQCHNVNGLVRISEPYGEVWDYCRNLVTVLNLPLVPPTEDSMSGVHIHVHHAYSKKLIRYRHFIPYYRAYKPRSRSTVVSDSRTLFLWYLDRFRRLGSDRTHHLPHSRNGEFFESDSSLMRSTVPLFDHKYVRKWTCWFPPAVGASDHLFWWSEYITPPVNTG